MFVLETFCDIMMHEKKQNHSKRHLHYIFIHKLMITLTNCCPWEAKKINLAASNFAISKTMEIHFQSLVANLFISFHVDCVICFYSIYFKHSYFVVSYADIIINWCYFLKPMPIIFQMCPSKNLIRCDHPLIRLVVDTKRNPPHLHQHQIHTIHLG